MAKSKQNETVIDAFPERSDAWELLDELRKTLLAQGVQSQMGLEVRLVQKAWQVVLVKD